MTTGPADILPLVGPYLARQRWAARGDTDVSRAELHSADLLAEEPAAVWWLLVAAGGAVYQLLVAVRPEDGDPPVGERDLLGGLPGPGGPLVVYDALADPHLARFIVARTGVEVGDALVRPIGAEQSNTSLVLDERVIVKFYRRLQPGPNPDVEVTTALDRVGFNHLASPLGVWRRDGYDLAVAQEFLAGGSEGWALALTSLRDFYGCDDEPAAAGGDFASESRRLGDMTAKLHLALAEAFGTHDSDVAAWVDQLEERVERLGLRPAVRTRVGDLVSRLRALPDVGRSIRVHGDYHLGQVMRTDTGWFVLDFEGEPARTVESRRQPWPAAKDVAGMLRSFDYAAAAALGDRWRTERDSMLERGLAWAVHNREAFLGGYRGHHGIEALQPPDEARELVLAFFELDKALYELGYERAHRPDWVGIPEAAIERLVGG